MATESQIKKQKISTVSEIKKNSIDFYGNIINYDPTDWVGEDFKIEKETIKSEEFKIGSEYGTFDVSIPDYLKLGETNVELSIIDAAYNMHNIYIYYRNNYHEKIKMSPGKYRINNISFLGIDGSNYELSTKKFVIKKDETTYVTIDHIYNEDKKDETISTNSEVIVNEGMYQRRSGSRLIFMLIFFVIVGIAMYFILKKRKERNEQF